MPKAVLGPVENRRYPESCPVSLGLLLRENRLPSKKKKKRVSHPLGDRPSKGCLPNFCLAIPINLALKLCPWNLETQPSPVACWLCVKAELQGVGSAGRGAKERGWRDKLEVHPGGSREPEGPLSRGSSFLNLLFREIRQYEEDRWESDNLCVHSFKIQLAFKIKFWLST